MRSAPAPRLSGQVRALTHDVGEGRRPWSRTLTRVVDGVRSSFPGPPPLVVPGHCGQPSIGYVGLPSGVALTLPFLQARRDGCPDISTWERRPRGNAEDVHLLLIGTTVDHLFRVARPTDVVMPMRLHLVVPLRPREDPYERLSRKERQFQVRQRKEHAWHLVRQTDGAEWQHFYRCAHTAEGRLRHGDGFRTIPMPLAKALIESRGRFLQLITGDRVVCGAMLLLDRRSSRATVRLIGHYDPVWSREHGATMAMFLSLAEYARDLGYRELDLSGTEPFLTKGIFQFKRRLHPRVEVPRTAYSRRRLLLRTLQDSSGLRDFLVANPVFQIDEVDATPRPVYFHDDARRARLDIPHAGKGHAAPEVRHLDSMMVGARP
jgi:hypothetical protein